MDWNLPEMSDKDFVTEYLEDFSTLVKPNNEIIEKIKKRKKMIQGNIIQEKQHIYNNNYKVS